MTNLLHLTSYPLDPSMLSQMARFHFYGRAVVHCLCVCGASQVAQWVKNLPAVQEMQETWVWSLGWKDSLGKEMATYSSIFAWRIPWTEEPGRLQSMGSQGAGHNWSTWARTHMYVCMYLHIPQLLYPFICWWTFRLFPCFGYCK